MVIQPNMSPIQIVDVWQETEDIFRKFNVHFTTESLSSIVAKEQLPLLLEKLNAIVGSSIRTCIEGG